ncbi:MAG: ornithine carbamoyltransferase [Candidatus Auribacterota bacterium]
MKKDLLSINDMTPDQINALFVLTEKLKKNPFQPVLHHQTLAMIFEKPSLRTRATFEVGMTQLGGHALYLQPSDIKLGQRESVADVARNLERWVSIVMARTFLHSTITELAENCSVPVINALSDIEHPCQALADFFTVYEHRKNLKGIKMSFIGDGNNVCHSLMLLAAKTGASFVVACPEGYEPDEKIVNETKAIMKQNGGTLTVTCAVEEAADRADALYTDVWVSMGQESETSERKSIFQPYQINSALVKKAAPNVLVMHCLPAHRGEEITSEVMDGPHSVVFDQAENRLHIQKAIMISLLQKQNLVI